MYRLVKTHLNRSDDLDICCKSLKHLISGVRRIQTREYKGVDILRCVSIFGGNETSYLHKDVLIYMNLLGRIFINPNAPECVKSMFKAVGVNI